MPGGDGSLSLSSFLSSSDRVAHLGLGPIDTVDSLVVTFLGGRRIEFRDVPADQLPHVFGAFWQADTSDRRGVGLGLAIAKSLIDAHDGRIWIESAAGCGTTVYFTLPKAATAA